MAVGLLGAVGGTARMIATTELLESTEATAGEGASGIDVPVIDDPAMPHRDRDVAYPVAARVILWIEADVSLAIAGIARTHKAPRLPVPVP